MILKTARGVRGVLKRLPRCRSLSRFGPVLLVAALAVAAYANSFPGSFIGDDAPIVRDNPAVQFIDLKAIFLADYWGKSANSGLYRPLTILSYAVNRAAFGADALSFHVVNVLLHAAVCAVLFALLVGVGIPRWSACLAGAVFAVHPIHGEVVNEVVGRAELLAALFVLLGLWCAQRETKWAAPCSAACCAAALLSKEHAVVFLPMLVAADAFRGPSLRDALRRRWGLYLLLAGITAGWLGIRALIRSSTGIPPDAIYPTDNPLVGMVFAERVAGALGTQLFYLRKLFVPLGLQAAYTNRSLQVIGTHWGFWGLVGAALASTTCAAGVRGWTRRSGFGLGILWYGLSFATTSNVFFVTGVLVAERFAYLPSAGFCLVLASLLPPIGGGAEAPAGRRVAWGCMLLYVLVLLGAVLSRNGEFRSPIQLWEATARRDPANVRAWYNLGAEYLAAGRLKDAGEAYVKSARGDPGFPEPYAAYGDLLARLGRPEEALLWADRGILAADGRVNPSLFVRARALVALGRPSEALAILEELQLYYSSWPIFWETRGRALDALGDRRGAVESFRVAVSGGASGDIPPRLAALLIEQGRYEEAVGLLRGALRRAEDGSVWNLLGVALALGGRPEAAAEAFRRAVTLRPEVDEYRSNLERVVEAAREGRMRP